MADGPNEVLTSLLDELGWSPRSLARRARRLRRCGRNEYVRDFLPTLDAALARQPRPA